MGRGSSTALSHQLGKFKDGEVKAGGSALPRFTCPNDRSHSVWRATLSPQLFTYRIIVAAAYFPLSSITAPDFALTDFYLFKHSKLATTYFPPKEYHQRDRVLRLCSEWEEVVPRRLVTSLESSKTAKSRRAGRHYRVLPARMTEVIRSGGRLCSEWEEALLRQKLWRVNSSTTSSSTR